MLCKKCNSVKFLKNGKKPNGLQRYKCKECGCVFTETPPCHDPVKQVQKNTRNLIRQGLRKILDLRKGKNMEKKIKIEDIIKIMKKNVDDAIKRNPQQKHEILSAVKEFNEKYNPQ